MNHSAPKILYTASSSAHLVSFHLPYLAALRSLGWDVTAAANGSGEGLGEGVRFLAVPFTKSFASPKISAPPRFWRGISVRTGTT